MHPHVLHIPSHPIPPTYSPLKGARSYFSKFSFVFHLKCHHTKDVNLKFQLNWSNRLDVVSYNYYVSFITADGYHIQTLFSLISSKRITFQLWNFMRYEKNMRITCDTKISKNWGKSWKDGTVHPSSWSQTNIPLIVGYCIIHTLFYI